MFFVSELIKNMYNNKEIIDELIKIDSEKMASNISFNTYLSQLNNMLSEAPVLNINQDTLFITEGDPILTVQLLKQLPTTNNYIIFINQGYIAMNKWFINEYKRITGNNNIELDCNINYNNYIKMGYKVIPLGEECLNNAVLEDFYD